MVITAQQARNNADEVKLSKVNPIFEMIEAASKLGHSSIIVTPVMDSNDAQLLELYGYYISYKWQNGEEMAYGTEISW